MKEENFDYKTTMDIPRFLIFVVAFVVVLGGALLLTSGGSSNNVDSTTMATDTGPTPTPDASGLKVVDEKVGTGDTAVDGKKVTVNYTGTLTDGSVFDSNTDPKFNHVEPFAFTLGAGEVIQGWDLGVAGMKVGGKRKLTIPSELGYGSSGAGNVIPPNATLIFEVELLKVE